MLILFRFSLIIIIIFSSACADRKIVKINDKNFGKKSQLDSGKIYDNFIKSDQDNLPLIQLLKKKISRHNCQTIKSIFLSNPELKVQVINLDSGVHNRVYWVEYEIEISLTSMKKPEETAIRLSTSGTLNVPYNQSIDSSLLLKNYSEDLEKELADKIYWWLNTSGFCQ